MSARMLSSGKLSSDADTLTIDPAKKMADQIQAMLPGIEAEKHAKERKEKKAAGIKDDSDDEDEEEVAEPSTAAPPNWDPPPLSRTDRVLEMFDKLFPVIDKVFEVVDKMAAASKWARGALQRPAGRAAAATILIAPLAAITARHYFVSA